MGLFLLLATTLVHGAALQPLTLLDQWDKQQRVDDTTTLLIFSNHRKGSAWVKTALQELKISSLAERHWLYVANISSMPGLITKLLALPKMRDYAFPVALVRDEAVVEQWPKKKGFVAVYSLNGLEIEVVEYFNSTDAIKHYLANRSD